MKCTYFYTNHPDCTRCSELGTGDILCCCHNIPLGSEKCRSGPAITSASHSSNSGWDSLCRSCTPGHTADIHHPQETLLKKEPERGLSAFACCLYENKSSNEPIRTAPLTLNHTSPILKIKSAATLLANLAVVTHYTPLHTVFTLARCLVGKCTGWTMRQTSLPRSHKIPYRRQRKNMF